MKPFKLYIAGLLDNNVDLSNKSFTRLQSDLEEEGYTLLYIKNLPQQTEKERLKDALRLILKADAVFLISSWYKSKNTIYYELPFSIKHNKPITESLISIDQLKKKKEKNIEYK